MKKLLIAIFSLIQLGFISCVQPKSEPATATTKVVDTPMLRTVNTFLNSLSETQRKKATFAFTDEERSNWYYVPRERNGIPLKELDNSQRLLAMAILQTALSEQGYGKAKAIIELEVILKALENRPAEDHYRDPEKYYFTFFGEPSAETPWGWRVEGHHLSLNFSSVTGAVVAATPAFMGSNPAIVPDGPEKGKQILKQEADMAFTLLRSFTPEQLKQVIIADVAPNEIVTSNSRKVMLVKPEGILYSAMSADQQRMLNQLIDVYINKYKKEIAQDLRARIEKAGMNQMHFAWAGSREPAVGQAHYYRIQSPVILIEYDNSQNNANHAHTVVRDLTNDFGEDALRAHYDKHQHNK